MSRGTCQAEIVDDDYGLQPCEKRAVGLRTRDLFGDDPWPACSEHIDARYRGGGVWSAS